MNLKKESIFCIICSYNTSLSNKIIGFCRGPSVQINIKRANGIGKMEKFGESSCSLGGNFIAIVHQNRAIFAHVETPLLGYVSKKGWSDIGIIPVLSKDPELYSTNDSFRIETKGTGEVR